MSIAAPVLSRAWTAVPAAAARAIAALASVVAAAAATAVAVAAKVVAAVLARVFAAAANWRPAGLVVAGQRVGVVVTELGFFR